MNLLSTRPKILANTPPVWAGSFRNLGKMGPFQSSVEAQYLLYGSFHQWVMDLKQPSYLMVHDCGSKPRPKWSSRLETRTNIHFFRAGSGPWGTFGKTGTHYHHPFNWRGARTSLAGPACNPLWDMSDRVDFSFVGSFGWWVWNWLWDGIIWCSWSPVIFSTMERSIGRVHLHNSACAVSALLFAPTYGHWLLIWLLNHSWKDGPK